MHLFHERPEMFTIPEDISVFSLEGLTDLRRVALDELTALRASATPDTVTDEQLERGEALAQFIATADEELSGRQARATRFNALPTQPVPPEPEPVTEPELEPTTAATEPVTAAADDGTGPGEDATPAPTRVGVQDMAPHAEPVELPPTPAFENHTILAAADIPGITTGSELTSWRQVAEAFVNRTRAYSGKKTPTQHSVVEIRRDFGDEFTFTRADTDPERTMDRLRYVTDQSRLEGGSLVAANGWCSPSENLYTTCNQVSTDGLYSAPEVSAPRGGINHNQGIEFDAIFGTGTGYNLFTEEDIISGVEKTCLEIPCPPFVDDRLKVSALCLTGSILQNRTYPEFVSEFVQGAVAVMAHVVNRDIISDVVAGSTAVNLTTGLPWNSDTSVVSQTLSAVEHAIVDIKYRLRLPQNSTLEIVLPFWILAQYRADYVRRNGVDDPNVADAELRAWFTMRSANPQYVYDWQDAFSAAGVGYGADTALTSVPTSVQFLVYPAGTWVVARLDVIRLDSIYDSVNLPQNMVTQLFQEDGYAAMRMCPLSRVYTVPICPSGATSALQEVCDIAS